MTYQIKGRIEKLQLTDVEVHSSGFKEPSQNDDYGVVGFNVVAQWHPTSVRSDIPVIYDGKILTPREGNELDFTVDAPNARYQGISEKRVLNLDSNPVTLFFIPKLTRERLEKVSSYGIAVSSHVEEEERAKPKEEITALIKSPTNVSAEELKMESLFPSGGELHRTTMCVYRQRKNYEITIKDYHNLDPISSYLELTGELSPTSYDMFVDRLRVAEKIARQFHFPRKRFKTEEAPREFGKLLFDWYRRSDGMNRGCQTVTLPIKEGLNARKRLEGILNGLY